MINKAELFIENLEPDKEENFPDRRVMANQLGGCRRP
jgi:hypothetical protein